LDGKKSKAYGAPTSTTGVEIVAIFALAIIVLIFLGVVASFSPLLAGCLFIVAAIVSVLILISKSSAPPKLEQNQTEPSESNIDLDTDPEQMVIAALMVSVRDAKVSTSALQRELNVNLEDAVRLICELQNLGLVFEKDDEYGKHLILRKRAFAVANVLQTSNFTRQLEELKPNPPHIVLGIPPSASMSDMISAYKKKRAIYDPNKVQQLTPDVQALAELRICDIENAYNQLLCTK
jgi:hypothetical protein